MAGEGPAHASGKDAPKHHKPALARRRAGDRMAPWKTEGNDYTHREREEKSKR